MGHTSAQLRVHYRRVNLYTPEKERERETLDSDEPPARTVGLSLFANSPFTPPYTRHVDLTGGRHFDSRRFRDGAIYLFYGGLRAGGGLSFSCGGGGGPSQRRIPLRWRRRGCTTRCFTEFVTNREPSNRGHVSPTPL